MITALQNNFTIEIWRVLTLSIFQKAEKSWVFFSHALDQDMCICGEWGGIRYMFCEIAIMKT